MAKRKNKTRDSLDPVRLVCNGKAIVERRNKLRLSRTALLAKMKRDGYPISRDCLERSEKSPKKPYRPLEENLIRLARGLALSVEAILTASDGSVPRDVRDCSGFWKLRGNDVCVRGMFDYPNGPRGLEAETEMTVAGTTVKAEGTDQDGDTVSMHGRIEEGGNQIVGIYDIESARMRIYGTVVLEFLACGTRMRGFYLGREIGEGTTYILGRLDLELVQDKPNAGTTQVSASEKQSPTDRHRY